MGSIPIGATSAKRLASGDVSLLQLIYFNYLGHVDILHGDFALKIDGWTK